MEGDTLMAHTAQCPIEQVLEVIGGKWKAVILWWLQEGPKRFTDLRRLMPAITQKMLTQQLRELETDGILHREVFAQVPPKVVYSLTALGEGLRGVLEELCMWSKDHIAEVEQARHATARRAQAAGKGGE